MIGASREAATCWFAGLLPEGLRRKHLARIVGTSEFDLWTLVDAAAGECADAVQIVNPADEDAPAYFPTQRLVARKPAAHSARRPDWHRRSKPAHRARGHLVQRAMQELMIGHTPKPRRSRLLMQTHFDVARGHALRGRARPGGLRMRACNTWRCDAHDDVAPGERAPRASPEVRAMWSSVR